MDDAIDDKTAAGASVGKVSKLVKVIDDVVSLVDTVVVVVLSVPLHCVNVTQPVYINDGRLLAD